MEPKQKWRITEKYSVHPPLDCNLHTIRINKSFSKHFLSINFEVWKHFFIFAANNKSKNYNHLEMASFLGELGNAVIYYDGCEYMLFEGKKLLWA